MIKPPLTCFFFILKTFHVTWSSSCFSWHAFIYPQNRRFSKINNYGSKSDPSNNHPNLLLISKINIFSFQKVSGKDASEHASGTENMMKIFLAAFSTAYNVVLYVVFNANFRRGLKEILCCRSKTQFRPEKPNKNKELSVVPSVSKKTTKSVMKTTE